MWRLLLHPLCLVGKALPVHSARRCSRPLRILFRCLRGHCRDTLSHRSLRIMQMRSTLPFCSSGMQEVSQLGHQPCLGQEAAQEAQPSPAQQAQSWSYNTHVTIMHAGNNEGEDWWIWQRGGDPLWRTDHEYHQVR